MLVDNDPLEKTGDYLFEKYPVFMILICMAFGAYMIKKGIMDNKSGEELSGESRIVRGGILVFIGGLLLVRKLI